MRDKCLLDGSYIQSALFEECLVKERRRRNTYARLYEIHPVRLITLDDNHLTIEKSFRFQGIAQIHPLVAIQTLQHRHLLKQCLVLFSLLESTL